MYFIIYIKNKNYNKNILKKILEAFFLPDSKLYIFFLVSKSVLYIYDISPMISSWFGSLVGTRTGSGFAWNHGKWPINDTHTKRFPAAWVDMTWPEWAMSDPLTICLYISGYRDIHPCPPNHPFLLPRHSYAHPYWCSLLMFGAYVRTR